MSFARLDTLNRRLEGLDHAQLMLAVDEAVMMPPGGGAKRAEALATLAAMSHELTTAPEVATWIDEAAGEKLDAAQEAALREFRRQHRNLTCLSSDFVARQVNARIRCEQLWRELRPRNDWQGFLPAFAGVVALAREEAERRSQALGLPPYDAMLDQYDPGSRASAIEPLFADLALFLKDALPRAIAADARKRRTRPAKPLPGPFAIDDQKRLGLTLMEAIGFDFDRGRLDISHHPFCNGIADDVRMTTRYQESEFISSLMGILHETGHGLYEQNLPRARSHWPSGKARGMALHESQSLFQETQVARRREFWEFAMPHVRRHLGQEKFAGWEADDMLAHVQRVAPGLIRVDADEATYPLHIILRFEIEQELIAGDLAPADLPARWDEGMRRLLGLSTLGNEKDGPMQDVHWPSGAFGYFPSYALGALLAAQMWEEAERAIPDLRGRIAGGDFAGLNAWRSAQVWSKASSLPMDELIRAATGKPLGTDAFKRHLTERYLT
ncbi:MAG: carboxypeptidase M32 [Alphaproteobacteria bacterium]|nr:carboxypeptidase M32 [Alphaproteobacteria bacterium]